MIFLKKQLAGNSSYSAILDISKIDYEAEEKKLRNAALKGDFKEVSRIVSLKNAGAQINLDAPSLNAPNEGMTALLYAAQKLEVSKNSDNTLGVSNDNPYLRCIELLLAAGASAPAKGVKTIFNIGLSKEAVIFIAHITKLSGSAEDNVESTFSFRYMHVYLFLHQNRADIPKEAKFLHIGPGFLLLSAEVNKSFQHTEFSCLFPEARHDILDKNIGGKSAQTFHLPEERLFKCQKFTARQSDYTAVFKTMQNNGAKKDWAQNHATLYQGDIAELLFNPISTLNQAGQRFDVIIATHSVQYAANEFNKGNYSESLPVALRNPAVAKGMLLVYLISKLQPKGILCLDAQTFFDLLSVPFNKKYQTKFKKEAEKLFQKIVKNAQAKCLFPASISFSLELLVPDLPKIPNMDHHFLLKSQDPEGNPVQFATDPVVAIRSKPK